MILPSILINRSCFFTRIPVVRCVSYVPKKKNYYDLLGVNQHASADQIKKAFARETRKLHPDTNKASSSNSNSTERFMEMKEAYDYLKKPENRKEYDRELEFSRKASKEMFYESLDDDPDVINLNLRGPHGYRGSRPPIKASRFGHFFNPSKEMEREQRDERVWKVLGATVLILILGNILFVTVYRARTLNLPKVVDEPTAVS